MMRFPPLQALLSRLFIWLLRVRSRVSHVHAAFQRGLRAIYHLCIALGSTRWSRPPKLHTTQTICPSSMPVSTIHAQLRSSDQSPSSLSAIPNSGVNGVTNGLPGASSDVVEQNGYTPFQIEYVAQPIRTTVAPPAHRTLTKIRPVSPDQVMEHRFAGRPPAKDTLSPYSLAAGDTDFDDGWEADGWQRCVQPEGAVYCYHQERRIITDVTEAARLSKVITVHDQLLVKKAQMPHVPSHSDVDFVIALCNGPNKGREWWYYLVDHRQRIIFWLHDYNLTKIFENVKGVTNKGHMKQAIITQYWIHVELYPNQLVLQAEDHQELQNVLNQAMADAITSNTSVTPLDTDVMAKMSELVDKFEGSIGKKNAYALWVIARFMRLFSHTKFVNFSGQPCARLNVDQSIYRPSDGPSLSLIIRLFDLLLFGSASVHAEELERTWVDQIVNFPRWKAYISKLTTEWSGFTFYSTVLLAVDVSLLAIPALGGGGSSPTSAVINGNSTITTNTTTNSTFTWTGFTPPGPPSTSEETAAIISIYLSIFFVVGSLVTSIQLSDRIRGKEHSSAPEIAMLLQRTEESWFGTDSLAIIFSLPYGLLIWGILLFVLAMSLIVLASTYTLMYVIIAPIIALLAVFAIWPSLGSRGYFSWKGVLDWGNVLGCFGVRKSQNPPHNV